MNEHRSSGLPEGRAERLIRQAQERGDFDDLPGAGRPIADLDRPFSADRWAIEWARREGAEVTAMLPPLLVLRRERAALLDSLDDVPTEAAVREIVDDFNHRLLLEYRRPLDGPLIPVGVLDVEAVVGEWRRVRPAPRTQPAPSMRPPPPPVPHRRHRFLDWLERPARPPG